MKNPLTTWMAMVSVVCTTGAARAEGADAVLEADASPRRNEEPTNWDHLGGRWLLGLRCNIGSATWTRTESMESMNVALANRTVYPSIVVGYALTDHWLLDGTLSFFRHDPSSGGLESTSVGVDPELSYGFGSARFRPYVGVHGVYDASWTDSSQVDSIGGGVHGGVRFAVSDRVSLDPMLGAQYIRTSYDIEGLEDGSQHSTSVRGGVQVSGWL